LTKKNPYLSRPVEPFEVKAENSARSLLTRMQNISFQGRQLGLAFKAWEDALRDKTTIFFGLAGAMVPAGMRKIVTFLIRNRLIDCLVSTGANLFHDLHETIGFKHYKGSHTVDDNDLLEHRVDRIYDTFASESDFQQAEKFLVDLLPTLDREVYTTRAFLHEVGKALAQSSGDGILASAYEMKVPVYCPAFADSSLAIACVSPLSKRSRPLNFDIVGDVRESAEIVMASESTAVIYVGGGTPKNFIQQTEVTRAMLERTVAGHKYAIQFTADAPHWGGLSGCTFDEAVSWGKVSADARKVTCHVDATIALPLVVSALAEGLDQNKRPSVPQFTFADKLEVTFS